MYYNVPYWLKIGGKEMNEWKRRLPRRTRRGLAIALVSALVLSVTAPVSLVQAAKQTKPLLNAKKKTLYYDKAGKKTFTLKVKKNKVKMIVATKWKTSKKSVVALSKKKDTSVKLTAKKKGKATITGTIKYVPRGKWAIKTAKLTCKVTSKSIKTAATPMPTQAPDLPSLQPGIQVPVVTAPSDDQPPAATQMPSSIPATEVPMVTEEPSAEPSEEPGETEVPDVTSIAVDPAEALLGADGGRDSVALTAAVTSKDGSEVEDAAVTWISDDEDVAEVDEEGTVTAVGGGTANITASAGGVTSDPCIVTVDDQAPAVDVVRIPDYQSFTVYFTEAVTGTPDVYVKSDEGKLIGQTAELAEDGKTMTVSCKEALAEGSYEININGLSDLAGNPMEEDTVASAEKKQSSLEGFACRNDRVPAGQPSFDVFFAAVDQYGQKFDDLSMLSEGELTVAAATENGMPFKAELKQDKGCITVTGPVSAFFVGRKIKITLTYSVEGEKEIKSVLDVVVADASNIGKPVTFGGLFATSEKMEPIGTQEPGKARFKLTGTGRDDILNVSAAFFDEFGYEANPADVVYTIDDESVLSFVDTKEPNSGGMNTSDGSVAVQALRGGTATIHAYLAEDDSLCGTIEVTIQSTNLEGITVGPIDEGINGRPSEAKITLTPEGTGITADQLRYRVLKGEERLKSITFIQGEDGIYVSVVAHYISSKEDAGGGDEPIEFTVVYDGNESNAVTYHSIPLEIPASIEIDSFDTNEVTAKAKATTSYRILNRYQEDITKRAGVSQPVSRIKDVSVISSAVVGTGKNAGTLTVQAGGSQGTTQIDLYLTNNPDISASLNVTVAGTAYVNEIRFDQLPEKENGLPLEDDEQRLYIPITAWNQYGREFASLTQAVAEAQVQFTIGKENYERENRYLIIEWCKKEGEAYVPAGAQDEVDAIAVRWNPDIACPLGEGMSIELGVKSKLGMEKFIETNFVIPILEARRLNKLVFVEDCKAAVTGAQVTNTIKLFDQHDKECKLPDGQTLGVKVTDSDGATQDLSKNPDVIQVGEDSVTCAIQTGSGHYPNENDIYTVRAYVKDGTGNELVYGKYTLIVDSAQTLIRNIKIADTARIDGREEPVQLTTTGPCVDLRSSVVMQFDCMAFTTYSGKEVEVCLKDSDGNLASSNNLLGSLKWKVSGATAQEQAGFGRWKFSATGTEAEVTVDLEYLTKGLKASSKKFKASGAQQEPQKKYQIVTYDVETKAYGTENLKDGEFQAEKDPTGYRFALRDTDQYGEGYDGISLDAAKTDHDDAVEIVLGKNGGFAENQFHITLKEGAIVGQTYTIMVRDTKGNDYSFAVRTEATPVEGVEIVPDSLELEEVGNTGSLEPKFVPAYATNQEVKWASDNADVVTVSATGVVTAVGRGEAEVTVTTEDGGKQASCTVIVGELTDAEKLEKAKGIVEGVLGGITGTNGMTQSDIQNQIESALREERLSDVGVSVVVDVKGATNSAVGTAEVTVSITVGKETDSVQKTIDIAKLPDNDVGKVAAVKEAITALLEKMQVGNHTEKADVQSAIDGVVRDLGLTGVSAVVNEWKKENATTGISGNITGTVDVKAGQETGEVAIRKMIDQLPVSDKDKVAAAKKVVNDVLNNMTVRNTTESKEIKAAVEKELTKQGMTEVSVEVSKLEINDADTMRAGSVKGTVTITRGEEKGTVTFTKTIGKLPATDAEKVKAAKEVVKMFLDDFVGSNDTQDVDIKEAVSEALTNAGITGVEVEVKGFIVNKANEEHAGSITGTVMLTSGEDASESVSIGLTIGKLESEEPGTATVTLNGNGGRGTSLTQYTPGTEAALPTDWEKKGYTFKGWYADKDCSGTKVTSISDTETGDKEYWAKWECVKYTITYVLDGGTVSTANPVEYTIESNDITLNNPTKSDHTFKGWSGEDLIGDSNQTVTIASGSTGNRTYTANWEREDTTTG